MLAEACWLLKASLGLLHIWQIKYITITGGGGMSLTEGHDLLVVEKGQSTDRDMEQQLQLLLSGTGERIFLLQKAKPPALKLLGIWSYHILSYINST